MFKCFRFSKSGKDGLDNLQLSNFDLRNFDELNYVFVWDEF